MEKKGIKRKVISAYKDAKRYPDFMPDSRQICKTSLILKSRSRILRAAYPEPGHQPGRKKPTNKVHYYFTQKSNDVFGFAGLYDQWEDIESGQTVGTFSIITTEANPLLANIHNQKERMPTILRQEDYDFWLLPLILSHYENHSFYGAIS